MFITWLRGTFRKRNKVRIQWNTGYDNARQAEKDEIDSFVGCFCCLYFCTVAKTWKKCTLGKRKLLQFQWNRGYDMAANPKAMSSFPRLSAVFPSEQIFLSNWTSNFLLFLGTVTCFQIEHRYMRNIVFPRFEYNKNELQSHRRGIGVTLDDWLV